MSRTDMTLGVVTVIMLVTLVSVPVVPVGTPHTGVLAVSQQHVTSAFPFQTFQRDMNVTTFVSPDGSRDALWQLLLSARQSIYVEVFGINNPYILDLIHEIHDARPGLDIKFLLGWNSIGYYSTNDYVANNLTQLGIPVRWTSDTEFTYAHQKFVIIDNKTTVVHAGNWAKTSFPEAGKKANREWSIAMTDGVVTAFYRGVFDYDWDNGIPYDPVAHGTGSPLSYSETSSTYPRPFSEPGHFSGDMRVTPVLSPDTSLQGILYCIRAARYTLDIQIPYFTNYGDSGAVDQIVDEIVAAKQRGVTVRVITEEGAKPDVEAVAQELGSHGIPVVYQDERWFSAEHNKGIIVDGRTVMISSINFSDGSITENREAGVIVEHSGVAAWYQDVYDFDWGIGDAGNSDEVNLYWTPNIPTSSDTINVTVYGHMLYPDIEEVVLGVKIGSGAWTNHTITPNVYDSDEGDPENYFYEIAPQPDGTNITVVAYVRANGVWHKSHEMTLFVRNSMGAAVTVDHPDDIVYEYGSTGHSITWTPSAANASHYVVTRNGTVVASGAWDGSAVTLSVEGLGLGTYVYVLFVNETGGASATDTVTVRVVDTTPPDITGPADLCVTRGTTGHRRTWNVSDPCPANYVILLDGEEVDSGSWVSGELTLDLDTLALATGEHTLLLTVWDSSGNSATDSVNITVQPSMMDIAIYVAIAVVGVVVALVVMKMKKGR